MPMLFLFILAATQMLPTIHWYEQASTLANQPDFPLTEAQIKAITAPQILPDDLVRFGQVFNNTTLTLGRAREISKVMHSLLTDFVYKRTPVRDVSPPTATHPLYHCYQSLIDYIKNVHIVEMP